jgi:hypothetical protein
MRADSKPQPPSPRGRGRKGAAGRPHYFGADELMEVWLAVQEHCARHERSVYKACQELELRFQVMASRDPTRNYTIRRETLRDRYYEAVRLLKEEREEREELIRSLRACGAASLQEQEPLPLASFWQELLAARLKSS